MIGILNVFIFIGTIVVNGLANIIPINNMTTGEVADLYPNLFVPAGITFSIWGLIYFLLGIFTVYQLYIAFKSNINTPSFVDKIGIWNIVLGLSNMMWILFWHYLFVSISVIIMLIMLLSLIIIYRRLQIGKGNSSQMEVLLVHINFSIYLGWISIATIANITAYLVDINWDGLGIPSSIWTLALMSVGVFLSLIFIYVYRDVFYALVVNWAYLGVYLKRTSPTVMPVRSVITWSIICIILLTTAIVFAVLKKRIYTLDEKN
ncbi:hypothetical protein HZR23_07295 [Serpentinicella alkaliphila]|nr:hypothetical protein HZR23_07295 [Serpentinicella alkaliphila]